MSNHEQDYLRWMAEDVEKARDAMNHADFVLEQKFDKLHIKESEISLYLAKEEKEVDRKTTEYNELKNRYDECKAAVENGTGYLKGQWDLVMF